MFFVGTKALSNVTQQFFKLNRFGAPFNSKKPKVAPAKFSSGTFSVGKKPDSSSDSEDDYETSIFQPSPSSDQGSQAFASYVEEGTEAIEEPSLYENPLPEAKDDAFLPSVGIVMSSETTADIGLIGASGKSQLSQSNVDNFRLATVMQTAPPEICVLDFGSKDETVRQRTFPFPHLLCAFCLVQQTGIGGR